MDELQEQIKTARKAGYSDDDIIKHLGSTDTRVKTAMDNGYSPAEILGHLQSQKQEPEKPGFMRSLIDRTPLGPMVAHAEQIGPSFQNGNYVDAAKHLAGISTMGMSDLPDMAANEAKRVAGHVKEAYNAPSGADALKHSLYSVPMVGGVGEQAVQDYKDGNWGGLAGTGLTMAIPGGDIAAVSKAGRTVRTAGRGFAQGVKEGYRPLSPGSLAVEAAGVAAHVAGQHQLGAVLNAAGVVVPAVRAGVQGARNALESNGAVPVQTSRGTFRAPGQVQYEAPPVHAEYPMPDLPIEHPAAGGHRSPQQYAGPQAPGPVEMPPGGHQSPQQYAGPPAPGPVEHMPEPAYPMPWGEPPAPGPIEHPVGGHQSPQQYGQAPGPAPIEPMPDPTQPMQWGYGGPGPRELPPGGPWGKGYRATKAPAPPAEVPAVKPAKTPTIEPGPKPTAGPSIAGNQGDMVIPQRYQGRNNPSAAWNVDKRIAAELKTMGIRPENVTEAHVNNAKSKLGHLRASPQLQHVRQTMAE